MKKNKVILLLFFIISVLSSCEKEDQKGNNNYLYPISSCRNIVDWDGLLNDSAMRTSQQFNAPIISLSFSEWIGNNSNRIDIRSLTSENFSDIQCLKKYIGSSSIVQLGESCHGTKEYSTIKVRLIKFLHQQMGFNVLAFESGFFECWQTNKDILQLSNMNAIRNSVFYGVWHTQDLLELFAYIKSTRLTSNPLMLSGFDCQFTSQSQSIKKHSDFLYNILSIANMEFATTAKTFNNTVITKIIARDFSWLEENKDSVKIKYREINEFIEQNKAIILNSGAYTDLDLELFNQTLFSIENNIKLIISDQTNSLEGNADSYIIRDSAMFKNFIFLKEKLYKGEKIITWAHNYHIAKTMHQHALYADVPIMGNHMHSRYGKNMYTIALHSLRGKTRSDWDWSIIEIPPPTEANSLEAILHSCKKKYLFTDFRYQTKNENNSWIFSGIKAKTSGFADETIIPNEVYDAVIFIDSSSVPVY